MDFHIGAVILAAGGASRYGSPKQLLMIDGKPMLQHVIDLARDAGFQRIVLILGAESENIIREINVSNDIDILINKNWREGQSSSVKMGVEVLEKDCDSIIFMLGDQPFIPIELITLEKRIFDEDKEIIAPAYNGKIGNPVLFSKVCFDELKRIKGDHGGKSVFDKFHITELEWDNEEVWMDIDTKKDLSRINNNNNAHSQFISIILAAGISSRMKQPKLVLPWGSSTVLGTVIDSFQNAGMEEIVVVTGGNRKLVEQVAEKHKAISVYNSKYSNGEMLDSLKAGLELALKSEYEAAFIALGDQPGIDCFDIIQMVNLFRKDQPDLIIPSYNMRRGHPWLVSRNLWPELMDLRFPKTMRDFIEENNEKIVYYNVVRSKILEDLDTPEDYERLRPR